jgi:gliding motility-associated-like protein
MTKKYIFILMILFITTRIIAQINLIQNPNFDNVNCEQRRIPNWQLQGFSLPANTCFPIGFSPGPNYKAPYISPNPWVMSNTYQQPYNGGGYIGLAVYGEYRGYATSALTQKLVALTPYYARFYTVPHYPDFPGFPWVFTDAIAMDVTYLEKSYQFNDNFNVDYPAAEHRGKVIRDTQNWTKVNGKFWAKGNEAFVMVGNLHKDSETILDKNRYNPSRDFINLFYVDGMVLSEFNPLPDSAILCENETKILDASFYDNPVYEWSDGSTRNSLSVNKPGKYWVTIRIDDKYEFSDSIVLVPEKTYKGLPQDTVACQSGPPVVLAISVDGKYKWSTGASSQAISVRAGTYTVTVTTPQCELHFSTVVKARSCFCNFYAPTVFSPNEDGQNDVFKPFINCKIVNVKDYSFKIFNRLGDLVFSTKKVDEGWHGTFRGQPCENDLYIWMVEYSTTIEHGVPYEEYIQESGDVTILR